MYRQRQRPKPRTPSEIVPSIPARTAYPAFHAAVSCSRRAACNASCRSRGRNVSSRPSVVTGKVLDLNPAATVRGPKLVVTKGKTPVLTAGQARELLDSIPLRIGPKPPEGEEDHRPPNLTGLRDRAIITAMNYSFARVSAIIGMDVEDYYLEGKRSWIRLAEEGGKAHSMPAHHNSEKYLDEYIAAANIANQAKTPLFRSASGRRITTLTANRMSRNDVFRMIRRRARAARLPARICCHSFRTTGITTYLENGGILEKAQQMAAHTSTKTTKLYDLRSDEVTLDEVERIII
jgi:integrase/recombinase XerD